MKISKIRVESFEVYGLNKYKNFLEGEEMIMNDVESVIDWAVDFLSEDKKIRNMAIFIHTSKDVMYAVTKEMEQDGTTFGVYNYTHQDDLDFFAQLDAEINFNNYALIMQAGKNIWRIIQF